MNTMSLRNRSLTCKRRALVSLSLAAITLLLGACASAPKPLRGDFAALTPQQASEAGSTGAMVRWGGTILDVETDGQSSCFVMLGRPLYDSSRPKDGDVSVGRFLACRNGFYDPAIFARDRQLTVIGHVADFETRPVDQFNYRYPRLDTDVIYLWPERDDDRLYFVGGLGFYPSPWGFHGYRVHHYVPRRSAPSKPAPAGK
ncbi:MAG: Slp family lipoprotein [Lysobacteraceae bacterium]